MWFESILVFILFKKKKKHSNISGIWVVFLIVSFVLFAVEWMNELYNPLYFSKSCFAIFIKNVESPFNWRIKFWFTKYI